MAKTKKFIDVPCLRVRQTKGRYIYLFSFEGKKLPDIATVWHVGRDKKAKLKGYQRPEQRRHIAGIREYIDSEGAFLPNAIVICFDGRVKFKAAKSKEYNMPHQQMGMLRFPVLADDEDRAGFIVDGQQRVAGVREALRTSFPLPIVGFITDDETEQREQFILVNSAKPLPRGLLHELAPHTEGLLPAALHRRRQAARLIEMLNHKKESPLHHMIKTPTAPTGVIRDNSMLRMLENSLGEGALRHFVDKRGGEKKMYEMLTRFWSAVAEVFEDAWGLPARKSRLMHGAGIVSVGNLMDFIVAKRRKPLEVPSRLTFLRGLRLVADDCAWTKGHWRFEGGDREWNELQNTRQDVERLREWLQDTLSDRAA